MDFGIDTRTTSLCLFASFRSNKEFSENVLLYINVLSHYFDYIIVITDIENGEPETSCLPPNCSLNLILNKGLDFGKYWSVLKPLYTNKEKYNIQKLALINDSCSIIRDLKDIFIWGAEKPFWGISLSTEYSPHLQSFFLVFENKDAVSALFEFVNENDIYKCPSRKHIINQYEIGLSVFMNKKGFELHALYDKSNLRYIHVPEVGRTRLFHNNVAFFMWPQMIYMGCPIIKNKKHSLRNEHDYIDQFIDKELKNRYLKYKTNETNETNKIFTSYPSSSL